MKRFLIAAMAGLALVASLWGGGAAAAENARVRVIHASPDAPNVDVYANGSKVLANVPFKVESDYLAVPAGSYKFEVFAAGTTLNPVLTVNANLQPGVDYTVAAVDRVSQLKYRVFEDNNAAPAAGKAHVSVIHTSADAPAVDVAVKGGPVLVKDISFGEKQGPLPVDAGRYDLELRVAGTVTVALPLNGVQLEAGKVYTFVATGLLSNGSLTVVPVAVSPAGVTGQVTPPRAGDAGLASQDTGSSAWILVLGAGSVALMAAIARRRLLANRA